MKLARIGPLWVDILLQLRLFPSRQSAERRLKKLEDSGRLRYAGRVSLDGHKPLHVWYNRPVPARMLRHEVDLMRVFFAFWPHAYAVTGEDVDPRWKADMELTIGPVGTGRTYMVEMDEGTERLSQVRRRLAQYLDCPQIVLFIVSDALRAAAMLQLTEDTRMYVSTIGRCLADPWGRHWRNGRGEAMAVAKPVSLPVA